ncbi:MAG: AAA family ATPase [Bryobacterales bacterium]|nr:AAA family ATPase [Bryobacterales bacterium]
MLASHISLQNWRNFAKVDLDLGSRVFLVGANASGKSNFLDAFRFLGDIAKQGGGLQKAISDRQGLSKIRCLAARRYPDVELELHLAEDAGSKPVLKYAIGIRQEPRGHRQPHLTYERVWKGSEQVLDRPDKADDLDPLRLTQTHLEQINSNAGFRDIAVFLQSTLYLHLVPQLLRHPQAFSGPEMPGDPFGRSFLERIARTPDKTRKARLRAIETALTVAVPQLKQLCYAEELGVPHLEAIYTHWRPHGGKQREDQFSDGTLRLIGLLWSMLEGDSLLLLEEPELSLNSGVVSRIPALMHRMQQRRRRQIVVSTHSSELLSDKSIGAEEVLLLDPSPEGTTIRRASDSGEVRALLEGGFSVGEAILPRTVPEHASQLRLF